VRADRWLTVQVGNRIAGVLVSVMTCGLAGDNSRDGFFWRTRSGEFKNWLACGTHGLSIHIGAPAFCVPHEPQYDTNIEWGCFCAPLTVEVESCTYDP
jgi:hypothetical protein